MILLIPGALITGLAVYYLAGLRHWLQDRRAAARARESARAAAELEDDPSGEHGAAFLASLRQRTDV